MAARGEDDFVVVDDLPGPTPGGADDPEAGVEAAPKTLTCFLPTGKATSIPNVITGETTFGELAAAIRKAQQPAVAKATPVVTFVDGCPVPWTLNDSPVPEYPGDVVYAILLPDELGPDAFHRVSCTEMNDAAAASPQSPAYWGAASDTCQSYFLAVLWAIRNVVLAGDSGVSKEDSAAGWLSHRDLFAPVVTAWVHFLDGRMLQVEKQVIAQTVFHQLRAMLPRSTAAQRVVQYAPLLLVNTIQPGKNSDRVSCSTVSLETATSVWKAAYEGTGATDVNMVTVARGGGETPDRLDQDEVMERLSELERSHEVLCVVPVELYDAEDDRGVILLQKGTDACVLAMGEGEFLAVLTGTLIHDDAPDLWTADELAEHEMCIAGRMPPNADAGKIDQVDVIILDTSGSMNNLAFRGDAHMTRIIAAQSFFSAFLDRASCLERRHAAGILSFGGGGVKVRATPSTDLHDMNEGALGAGFSPSGLTPLFDCIVKAVDILLEFREQNAAEISSQCQLRVLCLTDGEDTGSKKTPVKVAQVLQDNDVVCDAFCIGIVDDRKLRELCMASGGCMFEFADELEGAQLFASEPVLSIHARPQRQPRPTVHAAGDLKQFNDLTAYPRVRDPTAMNDFLLRAQARAAATPPAPTPQGAAPVVAADRPSAPVAPTGAAVGDASAPLAADQARAEKKEKSMGAGTRRVMKELTVAKAEGIQVEPEEGNERNWMVKVEGPPGSVYEGGVFHLTATFPADYPFKSPSLLCVTKVFHPCIDNDGHICMEMTTSGWSPAFTGIKVLQAFRDMLARPEDFTNEFINARAGQQLTDDREEFDRTAREWVQKFAAP